MFLSRGSRSPSSSHRNRRPSDERAQRNLRRTHQPCHPAPSGDRPIGSLPAFDPPADISYRHRCGVLELGADENRQLGHHHCAVPRRIHGAAAAARDCRGDQRDLRAFMLGAVVIGLATRLATGPLLGMTFVIEVFVYPEYWTQHLMWASILLYLLTKGPGVFSLDHYVERLFRMKGLAR